MSTGTVSANERVAGSGVSRRYARFSMSGALLRGDEIGANGSRAFA